MESTCFYKSCKIKYYNK